MKRLKKTPFNRFIIHYFILFYFIFIYLRLASLRADFTFAEEDGRKGEKVLGHFSVILQP